MAYTENADWVSLVRFIFQSGGGSEEDNELSVPRFAQHTDTSSVPHKWPNNGVLFY